MTTENKKSQSKTRGILALIIGIILTLGFIGNLNGTIKSIFVIITIFSGQVDAFNTGQAFGYLLFSSIILFFIIKLFTYSNKNLSKLTVSDDDRIDES